MRYRSRFINRLIELEIIYPKFSIGHKTHETFYVIKSLMDKTNIYCILYEWSICHNFDLHHDLPNYQHLVFYDQKRRWITTIEGIMMPDSPIAKLALFYLDEIKEIMNVKQQPNIQTKI